MLGNKLSWVGGWLVGLAGNRANSDHLELGLGTELGKMYLSWIFKIDQNANAYTTRGGVNKKKRVKFPQEEGGGLINIHVSQWPKFLLLSQFLN